MDGSLCVRVLEDDASNVLGAEVNVVDIHNLDLDSEGPCPCHDTADGLGVQLVREKESGSSKWIEYLLILLYLRLTKKDVNGVFYLFLLLTL